MKRRTTRVTLPIPTARQELAFTNEQAERALLPESLLQWPGFLLAWVAEMAGDGYARALAPLGIKPQHLGILTLLASEGAMVQARIGDRLTIVKPVIVGLINELEARRFVERRPHPTDRRSFEIHLLPLGRQCIQDAEAASKAVTATFFSTLTRDELKLFNQFLRRLAESNLSAPSGPASPSEREESL